MVLRTHLVGAHILALAWVAFFPAAGWTQDRRVATELTMVLDEAEAALRILEVRDRGGTPSEADWERLWESEGFRRLEARQESMGRAGTREGVADFLRGEESLGRLLEFQEAIARWRAASVSEAGSKAGAYLPSGTLIRAKVYPVIKHTRNSFVFDLDGDPAIFFSIGSFANPAELTNVMAHELHHVGSAQCPEPLGADTLPPGPQRVVSWLSAFGEGMAVLAAAGGPDTHPHASSPSDAWLVWERDVGRADADVTRLSAFFQGIVDGSIPESEQRERLFAFISTEDVPQGAFYTVGWKMAAIVERIAGREQVISAVCDPRLLLSEYNRAVSKLPAAESLPVWPEALLHAIGARPLPAGDP